MPQITVKTNPSSSSADQTFEVGTTEDRDEFIKFYASQIFWYTFPEDDDWHRGPAFKIAEEAQALAVQAESSDDDEDRL